MLPKQRINTVSFGLLSDEYSDQTEIAKFFQILGSGSAAKVPEEAAGGDDAEFETKQDVSSTFKKYGLIAARGMN